MSNLNSKSKLTEFPALEPEEKPEGIKFSFSKFIWSWKKGGGKILDRVENFILEFYLIVFNCGGNHFAYEN